VFAPRTGNQIQTACPPPGFRFGARRQPRRRKRQERAQVDSCAIFAGKVSKKVGVRSSSWNSSHTGGPQRRTSGPGKMGTGASRQAAKFSSGFAGWTVGWGWWSSLTGWAPRVTLRGVHVGQACRADRKNKLAEPGVQPSAVTDALCIFCFGSRS